MGTITAQNIIDKVAKTLFDDTGIRWSQAELLGYLNDGSRHIVLLKPDAYSKTGVIQANVSDTKNTIPADGIRLKRPVRNMGSSGATPGRAITWASMDQLDKSNPNWHTDTANSVIEHFLQDPGDPKTFYVYPPQPSSSPGYAEIIYFASPPDVTATQPIPLDDVYLDGYRFYVLAAAHAKEAPEASAERSTSYYGLFLQAVGLKTQGERSMDSTRNNA